MFQSVDHMIMAIIVTNTINLIVYSSNWMAFNCIGGVMVNALASSMVDRAFQPWSYQTKDYNIGICCFSTKHAALRRKSKNWLAWNQDDMSEWGDMSIRRGCFSELAL